MNTHKPVILYRSELTPSKGRKFIASALLAVSLGIVSLQAGFVLNASAQNNPITSAITSAIVCPEGHSLTNVNGAAVCVSQSNSQNQQNNNNQNNGSTINNPITAPEVTAPEIKVLTPNGGESYVIGQTITIAWEAENAANYSVYKVDVDYPQNPVWLYTTYDADQKSFDWNVYSLPGNFKIRVVTALGNGTFVSDDSDDYFTVVSAPVTAPEVSPSPDTNQSSSQTPLNNNGGSSSSGDSSAASCNNEAPKAPKIISAVTSGNNEIILSWEKPVSGNVSHYSISYGLVSGKPLYGVANAGNVNAFKVAGLAGGVTYYFTVKAVNDCTPSAASNEAAVKVGGRFINTPAQGFSPVILGKTKAQVKSDFAIKPAISKPVVVNNNVESKAVNLGLAGKVLNFFKGLFN